MPKCLFFFNLPTINDAQAKKIADNNNKFKQFLDKRDREKPTIKSNFKNLFICSTKPIFNNRKYPFIEHNIYINNFLPLLNKFHCPFFHGQVHIDDFIKQSTVEIEQIERGTSKVKLLNKETPNFLDSKTLLID